MDFDEAHWATVISQPDWYLEFNEFKVRAEKTLKPESADMERLNKQVRHFFEAALKNNQVALAQAGPDLDDQRQPVDTIVIHHTSAKPGYRLSYLNAVHLLNIYAPYFAKPTVKGEEKLQGEPVWSGHFSDGRQVFWGYHWLIRSDGEFIRLLEDDQIGWHAGNWHINRRSAGICLDNDYENACPTDEFLDRLAKHIRQNYPQIRPDRVIGHCEARQGTACPGGHFLSEWKNKIVEALKANGP